MKSKVLLILSDSWSVYQNVVSAALDLLAGRTVGVANRSFAFCEADVNNS